MDLTVQGCVELSIMKRACLVLVVVVALLTTLGEGFSTAKKTKKVQKKKTTVKKEKRAEKTNKASSEGVCKNGEGECTEEESKVKTAPRSSGIFVFPLEHSVSPSAPFVGRGSIEVEISKSTKQIIVRGKSRSLLTSSESSALLKLAESGGFYRLRMPSRAGETSGYVVASIPACALVVGGLREQLFLHIDVGGELVGIEYRTPLSKSFKCKPSDLRKSVNAAKRLGEVKLSTSAVAVMPRKAHKVPLIVSGETPPPPGMEHLKKKDPKSENPEENQSFLRRYWYIVLPLVLFMLFGGG